MEKNTGVRTEGRTKNTEKHRNTESLDRKVQRQKQTQMLGDRETYTWRVSEMGAAGRWGGDESELMCVEGWQYREPSP